MSTRWRDTIGWGLAAILGFAATLWLYQHLFVFAPRDWTTTREQAVEIANASFPRLGPQIEKPYVVAELRDDYLLEKQLHDAQARTDLATLRQSPLAERVVGWRITVYEPAAQPDRWTYRATVSPKGELISLRLQVPGDEAAPPLDPSEARRQADTFLEQVGIRLADYDEPTLRRTDRSARTDLSLRYPDRAALLSEGVSYGIEVSFAGDRLQGFEPWVENPRQKKLEQGAQLYGLLANFWIMVPFLVFPFVAFFFLRRYHAGEIGVRRAMEVFVFAFICGALTIALSGRGSTEGANFGVLSRQQVAVAWQIQIVIFWFAVLALVAALSWSVGEASCRERWGHKLAAFDALFKRRWGNATVARSALRGFAGALVLTALVLLVLELLSLSGARSGITLGLGPWWQHARWPGLALALFILPLRLYSDLFAWLFLLPAAVRRFGVWPGTGLVVALSTVIFWPPLMVDPAPGFLVIGAVRAAALAVLFLRYDFLTTLLAGVGSSMLLSSLPLLLADNPSLIFQGALPLVIVALPLLLSARYLGSEKELTYRWEDVPQHVRRIAERERQRVELETARQIQSSILPDLPPRLAGVDLAHCYLPATEVGGDFYDVLALEDGRLAVAVGDVAGHGVSSGLIMSMAKSTLALQVTVNPEAQAVFQTLNRMVYQSARLRLLTTLCYALVDRDRRELVYASAGHLAPYRIDAQGRVEALSSASYPLGVRDALEVRVRTLRLEAGDRLFLYSDGVVEARRSESDEVFGFERLEESLKRHAEADPAGLRDGVLEDVRQFTGGAPRDDDQTILVLRVP